MLDELIARVEAGEISAEDAADEAPLHRGQSVAVTIHLSGNVDGVVRFLQDNGVSPRNVGEDYIEAFIPILLLPQTSEQSGVLRVEVVVPAESFQGATPVAGNGPAVHGSPAWNRAEHKGQGIKVGIIDGGFEGFSGLMGTEVPQSVEARCYPEDRDTTTDVVTDCAWNGAHGTQVAESVMDIAPEAALYIANLQTKGDLRAAVQWMIDQGVDVINHSVGWTFDGPGDGTSPYSWSPLESVDRAVDNGIVWVNSAGNEARTTWFGSPSDADGNGYIEFATNDETYGFDLYPSALTVQLRWDDSWSGAVRDLDFYIYDRDDGRELGKSDRKQSGSNGETPFESLSGDGSGRFYIGIVNRGSSMPSWIQLTLWGDLVVEHYTDNGSITNPAESRNPGMLTVGAAHWGNMSTIETYSSRGPTPDGRIKPDLVAAACGRTTYDSEFCGTSQASPHVAGMAALVRQRFPDFTPAQVASYLKENAEQRISSPDPNNTWGHGFIVLPPITADVASLSDLVVDAPTVDTGAPTAGASFTLSAIVRNQGSGRSDSTTLRYYQSADSAITTGDTEVGTDSVSSLDASASGEESISLTAPSTAGTYYYGACVDAVPDESDTTNNCSPAVTVTVGAAPAPDLVVDAPTVSESAPTAGARFTLSAAARNQGSARSDSTTLRYYQSADSAITTGDMEVGTDSVFGLTASRSGEESISLTAPSTAGTYYYGACVDAVPDESDTTNNCSPAVTVTVGAAPAPDLVVDAPTASESAPTAGARFTLSATVRNQGSGRSDSTTLRYYLSTDATITTSDTSVGTDSVFRLSASESGDESISLTAPSTAGTYYYGACVDAASDESDTTNNCSPAVTVTVGAPPVPDLVVDAPTVSESAPTAGARFTLSATARNQGSGRSDSTTLRYYQSADSAITTGDTEVGSDSVFRLDASSNGDESISLTAPSTAGTYYYGACVDAVSDESDTTNNCSAAVTVTVGAAPAPDLVVDAPTVSESAPTAGARFTLSATARNQGSGRSESTTLRYYRSTDSTITTGDTEVGTDAVFGLAASRSGEESISLTAPSTAGTYYYGACVDAVPDESDTTNNCSAAVTVTVGAAPAPDLVVDAPTASESAPTAGARFTLSATVRNQGSGRSESTTLRYYLSTDATITTSDTSVGTDSVFRLDASASGGESISLTAPSSAGTYYYGACVDAVSDESDTANNCSPAVTVTVGAAPAPDLVVNPPTVSEGAPTAGARFTLSAAVRNQGSGRSDSTTLRYYQSADSAITTGDSEVGTDSVSRLDASSNGDESISLTAPSTAGTYYYGACVDALSDESDTTNNCSVAVAVTVGAALSPDLVVSTFTVSNNNPVPGQYFIMNIKIKNQGNGMSSPTRLRYFRSSDATITTDDAIIPTSGITGFLSLDGLSPSGSVDKSASTRGPLALGTYYYGACVEPVTGESDTTNNCSPAAAVTVDRTNQPPQLTGDVDDRIVKLGSSFTVDISGLFTDPDGDEITSYGFVFRTSGILSGVVNTRTGILSLRAIAVGETIVAVDARDSNGASRASEDLFKVTVTAAETLDEPGAPTGLTATADGQTEIDLSWTAPSDNGGADITGYRIEVSSNGSSWSDLVANTGSITTSYSHTGLTAGATRHYRVSAINSAGTGPASGSDSATTDEEPVSDGTCTVNLIVEPGDSCIYPGTSAEFSVDSDGTGRFLIASSGSGIELRSTTINGVTYTLVASKQSDGNWIVEEVG